jgi:glycosyltransferase involved in cell wall biosynthesis
MGDLVSILIPAYNAEKWVKDTITSAVNQTWPDKEIIIIDDGSTDNTLWVAQQFNSKSIQVVTQENRGASAARNRALALAQGDYIQWLDADDLLAPDKIEQQMKQSIQGGNTQTLLSSAWGRFYFQPARARFTPNSLWQDLMPVEWILTRFRGQLATWMQPAAWLVSRRLIEVAGPWDERLSLDDDGEYSCRLVAASKIVTFVPSAKTYYRIGNLCSLSQPTSDKAIASYFLAMCLCIKHLRSLDDSQGTRDACIEFLQNRIAMFYPEKNDLVEKANRLALDLGGSLVPPKESWKFKLVRKICGWKMAKNIRNVQWGAEVLVRKHLDRVL